MAETLSFHVDDGVERDFEDMTMTATIAGRYEAVPFLGLPERAPIVSHLLRSICSFETIFSDYTRGCEERCFECERCRTSMAVAARILSNPASIVWEVWEEGVDLPVGVMVLANINPGVEAHVHFAFFDGKLRSKKELMDELVAWTFAERDGWVPPKRLTTEIPDYAFALAKFAHRHMGFGGDYTFTSNGQSVNVEGVRRKAVRWRGADRDVLLMGRLRDGA